ncbi:MAG TPA: acyl-CoA dehydrogenase [Desulfobacteraceae bacterium]|mgnify:CR=1 FL=1|nr:acyl-CoA dehydrogenase [Desulfobacteraceae bacterium]
MAQKFMSMQNLKFTLATRDSRFREGDILNGHTPKTVDMVFKAARDIAKNIMHPMFEEMDRNPPQLDKGTVRVHPGVRPMLETLGTDGWIAAPFPDAWDGEDMPDSLLHCINFIFATANYSAAVYAGLTMGAAKLLLSFGSESLQERFLPKMLSGRWQGTMALTEPEAGTSLGDLVTCAAPVDGKDGVYRILGEKIFISAGDHDAVDNVVHLMLARIEGATPGVKGISLFAVPKLREDGKGGLEPNDVTVTQVFHKLGYRGAPITGLRLGEKGDCLGWLVGEPHRGLSYMFQMMNGARLEVGMGATAIATAAYHAALDYCRGRHQGRPVTAPKGFEPVPIIRHADVRRMLLLQRAVTEGSLSLILHCGMYEDILAKNSEAKDCHLLLELLTPVAKTYPSEMGIQSTSAAIQCFGGYGYCDDFPVEQHFRDMRIHPIHEGTTGIQAMDLLGRKLTMENGRALRLLRQEIEDAIAKAKAVAKEADAGDRLTVMADDLSKTIAQVETTAMTLGGVAMEKGPEAFLSDATLFLEMFGIMAIAWQWLTMATAATQNLSTGKPKKKEKAFLEGKIHTARYFFAYELPKTIALETTLNKSGQMTLDVPDTCFTD